jgi:hypothetical protein
MQAVGGYLSCTHEKDDALDAHLLTIHRRKVNVASDGNCQFRAVAQQLQQAGCTDDYRLVRVKAVQWLRDHGDFILPEFEGRVDTLFAPPQGMSWFTWCDNALASLGQHGTAPEWGDQNTLFGVSAVYGVMINVVSDVCGSSEWLTYARLELREYSADKVLYIGFDRAKQHYYGTVECDYRTNSSPSCSATTSVIDKARPKQLHPDDFEDDAYQQREDIDLNQKSAADDDDCDDTSASDEPVSETEGRSDKAVSSSNLKKDKFTAMCEISLVDAILQTDHSVNAQYREVSTLLSVPVDLSKVDNRHAFEWNDVFELVIKRLAVIEDVKGCILPANNKIRHLCGLPVYLQEPVKHARLPSLLLAAYTSEAFTESAVVHSGVVRATSTQHQHMLLQSIRAADTSKGTLQLRLLVQPYVDLDDDSDSNDTEQADDDHEQQSTPRIYGNQERLADKLFSSMIVQLAARRGADVIGMSVSDALKYMKYKRARFAVIGPNSISLQQQSYNDLTTMTFCIQHPQVLQC